MVRWLHSVVLLHLMEMVSTCEFTHNSTTGVINSPNYPSAYLGNTRCWHYIRGAIGERVVLRWKYFKFSGVMPYCNDDFVRVYIGCGSAERILTKFCNQDQTILPSNIYSKDSCMTIEFFSDSFVNPLDNGFSANYYFKGMEMAVSPEAECGNQDLNKSGIIKSPYWPETYHDRVASGLCRWRLNVKEDHAIKLLFMDMDTYAPNKRSPERCWQPGNDYLEFKGKLRSDGMIKTYRFCNRQKSSFYRFYWEDFEYVDFTFAVVNKANHSAKGFMIGYNVFPYKIISAKKDEDDDSGKWWFLFVPISIAILVLIYIGKKMKQHGGICFIMRKPCCKKSKPSQFRPYPKPDATLPAQHDISTPAYAPPTYQQIWQLDENATRQHQRQSHNSSTAELPPSYEESVTLKTLKD